MPRNTKLISARPLIVFFVFTSFSLLFNETLHEVVQTIRWIHWTFLYGDKEIAEIVFRLTPTSVFLASHLIGRSLLKFEISTKGSFATIFRTLTTLNSWQIFVGITYWATPSNIWWSVCVMMLIHTALGVTSFYLTAVVLTRTRPVKIFGLKV